MQIIYRGPGTQYISDKKIVSYMAFIQVGTSLYRQFTELNYLPMLEITSKVREISNCHFIGKGTTVISHGRIQ